MAARAHFGVTELAVICVTHLPAQLLRHSLHAVADAQHRNAEPEHCGRDFQRGVVICRRMTAGKNDALEALGHLGLEEIFRDVTRV